MILTNRTALTAEDIAENELIDTLLTAPRTTVLTILDERLGDETLVAAMLVFLNMTKLVIEACTARLGQDESLTADEALARSIELMHQWAPAPLAVAFGTPEARGNVQDATEWIASITAAGN
jgi:hypothetical protein